jgi:hypothetical protein
MARPLNITEKQVEQALRKTAGIMGAAAEQLGCSRPNVVQRVASSKKLQAVIADVKERTLDLAESKLVTAIKNGEMSEVRFYLKTQGKHRGYVERHESTGPNGGPLQVATVDAPPAATSIDEWMGVKAKVDAARSEQVAALAREVDDG